ncbi:zinc-ribbon domain-containing protein [Acidocella aquatica]|nr:zinc-ribbon domain-containing protein [Acidocella aquatica]
MQLLCPSCSTVYEVPDAALAGRSRKLHCVQCGTDWRSEPLSPDLARVSDFAAPLTNVDEGSTLERVDTQQAGMQNAGTQHAATQMTDTPLEADPALGLSMFLSSGEDANAPLHQPGQGDAFADLVHAARNNTVEYEPETPPRQARAVKISNLPLVLTLVVLLAAGLAGLAFLGHFGHIV